MMVNKRYRRVPHYPIYLPSEKGREVPKKSTPKKRMSDNIKVCRALFLVLVCEYHKYQAKTKYRSKERKMIVLRDKKQSQKGEYIPMSEFHQDVFLLYPFRKYIENPREKKQRKCERNDRAKYRFRESFFPRKSVQENKE